MIEAGLFWGLLAGVYLVLAGSVTIAEAAAAILCGGLGAVWVRRIRHCGDHHMSLRAVSIRPMLSALATVLVETLKVGVRLARAASHGDVSGEDRALMPAQVSHCPLSGDDPKAAGARALSVLAGSLSPDTYVLRLERERGRVLVHSILPARGRAS